MKEKISKWFRQGLWTLEMVGQAVEKGLITAGEFQEITGFDYPYGEVTV